MLGGLIGTPFDPFESVYTAEAVESGAVARPMLFIEDIAEPIYKVERILWQLHLPTTSPWATSRPTRPLSSAVRA